MTWLGSGRVRSAAALLVALLAACSSAPPRGKAGRGESRPAARAQGGAPAVPLPTNPRGGYYGDDGPPDAVPPGLELTPDPVPRAEPLSPRANRPYVVFGRTYQPMTRLEPYRERGAASWYGRKFHGQATSSGEAYDMFGMSAAHPTLPLPSYARVTNLRNGRSVIVRVNDRGPFLNNRLIDLSYTAALKLGYAHRGSTDVEVESILPDDAPPLQIAQAGMEEVMPSAAMPSPAAPPSPVQLPASAGQEARPARVALPAGPAPESAPVAGADEPLPLVVETLLTSGPGDPPSEPVASPGPAAQPAVALSPESRRSASVPGGLPAPSFAPAPGAMASGWPAPPSPPAPSTAGARAFVQLGAFASRGNADAARGRVAGTIRPAGPPIEVVEERGLFKLLAGPLSSRDASTLAERIRQATGSRPFVVMR